MLTEYAYTYEEKTCVREGHLEQCLQLILNRHAVSVKRLLFAERIRLFGSILAAATIGYLVGSKDSPQYFTVMLIPLIIAPRLSQLLSSVRHQARLVAVSDIWRMKTDTSSMPADRNMK